MKNKIIITIALVVAVAVFLLKPISLEKQFERNGNKQIKIEKEMSVLYKKYKELKKEEIKLEQKNFVKQKFKTAKSEKNDGVENMVARTQTKLGIPYVLGGRGNGKLDCSGLIGGYAYYSQGSISWNDYINHTNAENISKLGEKKDIENVVRGDLMFFEDEYNGISHIAMVLNVNLEKGRIFIVDSSYGNGVSNRILYLSYRDGKITYYNDNYRKYDITFTSNPYIKDMELIGDFLISSYIPKTNIMDINGGGASGRHTASGLPLKDEYAGEVVACPKQYPFGTRFYIEGFGEVVCKDRGGLIVMKGDVNSRGNISSNNRLDIFAGLNTAKITRNQTHRNVYLIK